MKEPVTQKAIGILNGIKQIGYIFKCHDHYVAPAHKLIQSEQDIEDMYSYALPGFARPCPKMPRHGFVESRPISTKEQLKKLFKEVKREDPDGEIVIGPSLPGIKCSAVFMSSGMLSIGPGNDGATAGKKSFSLPVAPLEYTKDFLNQMKIQDGEAVYLEEVFEKESGCYITQVRGGPSLSQVSADFIPGNVKVKKVEAPLEDLLAWEKKVKTFAPGTVVYGNGSTLASHAAVHCVLHKVPFITTTKPKVGDTLKSTEVGKTVVLKRANFRKGVSYALKMSDRGDLGHYFKYCLSVLHNWAYLKNYAEADKVLGTAVTLLVKLCAALSFGEYRHSSEQKMFGDKYRDDVYSIVLGSGTKYLNRLPAVCKNFCTDFWDSGFGDLPWASCAWYSAKIWGSIIKMYNKTASKIDDKEVAQLMDYINRTMNLVHNSNWWFDKISQKEVMDFAADRPGLCAALSADVFFRVKVGIDHQKKIKDKLGPINKTEMPLYLNSKNNLISVYAHPEDDSYNAKCTKCGYYDCWCRAKKKPTSSTIKFWRQGHKSRKNKSVKVTYSEFKTLEKRAGHNGRVYLKVNPGVGVVLPNGRTIKCGAKYNV